MVFLERGRLSNSINHQAYTTCINLLVSVSAAGLEPVIYLTAYFANRNARNSTTSELSNKTVMTTLVCFVLGIESTFISCEYRYQKFSRYKIKEKIPIQCDASQLKLYPTKFYDQYTLKIKALRDKDIKSYLHWELLNETHKLSSELILEEDFKADEGDIHLIVELPKRPDWCTECKDWILGMRFGAFAFAFFLALVILCSKTPNLGSWAAISIWLKAVKSLLDSVNKYCDAKIAEIAGLSNLPAR